MLERVRRPANYDAPTVTRLLEPIPLYHDLPAGTRAAKRALDILFSIGALVLYGALLPVLAIAIKVDSPGPVFYSQVRVGINRRQGDRRRTAHSPDIDRRSPGAKNDRRKIVQEGRAFVIYKLRTMYQDSESQGVRWSQKGDSRITRVGRILRKTRLDEFPQFWNVLRGEMSVVGPRPEQPGIAQAIEQELPAFAYRTLVKPGITGWAQIHHGYAATLDDCATKLAYDLYYVRRYGLLLDIDVILRTLFVMLGRIGAR
jgi:lipopolysaccharide/colanic/teichoic acid biosynthesis glycosyltransferase